MSSPTDDQTRRSTSLEKLGEFLRSRRLLATPKNGAGAGRRRKTPGVRREEVAMLAGLSVDWYSRIELGTGVVPSTATLLAIARALHLTDIDTRYLFELADLPIPSAIHLDGPGSLVAIEHAILNLRQTAAEVFDTFGSPLCWNAIADALFGWSSYPDEFSRNMIVAGLNNERYYQEFFGSDFDLVARRIVGVFRRAYTTSEPTPLARRVYEYASGFPLFKQYWNEHTVAEDHTPIGPFVRYAPTVGRLVLDFNDLTLLRNSNLIFRFIAPHDEETRRKFDQLEPMGKARSFSDSLS